MRIDLHTHILPKMWPDLDQRYGYPGWVRIEHAEGRARLMIGDRFFRALTDHCWDISRRLEDCDRHGIDVQVLSTLPVMFSYWARPADALDLSKRLNEHIAEVVREHPRRFAGLGTIPLQDPDLAMAELERCAAPREKGGLGLAGVQIGTNVQNTEHLPHHAGKPISWNLDAPELFPVFQRAAELGAAVFVHPWEMIGRERMDKYFLPWLVGMPAETCLAVCCVLFSGLLERLPSLRIAFAHGAGSFPGTIGRIERGFRARPDLCAVDNGIGPRAYLAQRSGGELRPARFFVDSLTHDEDALCAVVKLFGAQRVALGTDYPFPLGEPEPGRLLDQCGLSAADKRMIFADAALEFLGLSRERFAR